MARPGYAPLVRVPNTPKSQLRLEGHEWPLYGLRHKGDGKGSQEPQESGKRKQEGGAEAGKGLGRSWDTPGQEAVATSVPSLPDPAPQGTGP